MDERGKHGSQPIGGLIERIASTQQPVDGTDGASTSRPRHSEITTSRMPASRPTGTLPGGHGCGEPTSTQPGMRNGSTALALDSRDPGASLPRRVTSCLASTWIDGDVGYGWDGRVGSYELVAEPPAADLAHAIDIAETALAPAPPKRILAELTRLRALTVSRDQSTTDLELIAAAYTDELAQYPVDAVVSVLRDWPRAHRFWPSFAELNEQLERIVTPRRELLRALRRGYQPPETSPDWVKPSPQEIAEAEALLEKHGIRLDHNGRARPLEREPMTPEARDRMAAEIAEFRSRFAQSEAAQ